MSAQPNAMQTAAARPVPETVVYPDSDGKPMSDNTLQFQWIVTIKENLDALLPDDFVAGDLLWYPVEGNPKIRQAPDVLVAIGRPKGYRGSYQQWRENGVAPRVVFEILSPGNTALEMARKQSFYERYGVEEFYIYDPDSNELAGWIRTGALLDEVEEMNGWTSPGLGIRFELDSETLRIIAPDGSEFQTFSEVARRAKVAERRAEEAEQELEHLRERLRALGVSDV